MGTGRVILPLCGLHAPSVACSLNRLQPSERGDSEEKSGTFFGKLVEGSLREALLAINVKRGHLQCARISSLLTPTKLPPTVGEQVLSAAN